MVTRMVILLQKNFIQGYHLVPLVKMHDILNVLKAYCSAFTTNCPLDMPLQVFFFSFILAYYSKCYHRTRIIEINMEISGQVMLDLLGGIGVVEDRSS